MLTIPPQSAALAHATLRARLATLGLPSWRCDNAGLIIEDPLLPGPAGLLLKSGRIAAIISRTIAGLGACSTPQVVESEPGLWIVGIPEKHRRERTGWIVTAGLSPEFLESECFLQACSGVHLDLLPTRIALRPLAVHDRAGVEHLAALLSWASDDLTAAAEAQHTISGFTRQLTDSFETIDLLYTLGRFMGDPTQPGEFIQTALERLTAAMQFGWTACWLGSDPRTRRVRVPVLTLAGSSVPKEADVLSAATQIASRVTADGEPLILNGAEQLPLAPEGQYLVQPVARNGRMLGVLIAGDKRGDDPQVSSYDIHLLEAAAAFMAAFTENAILYAEQQAMFLGSLTALTASIDAKDRYTFGHSERVAHLGRALALAAGLGPELADRVHICGLVHDVGKIGVPEAVLLKPGKLTPEEFEIIKRHPDVGHKILRDIPLMQDILPGVLHHHERYDGKGYPHGLAGENIPLLGRILAIADTFDAMSSNRSYRPALPRDRVYEELRRCAGSQFDPALVEAFVARVELGSYDRLVATHRDTLVGAVAQAA